MRENEMISLLNRAVESFDVSDIPTRQGRRAAAQLHQMVRAMVAAITLLAADQRAMETALKQIGQAAGFTVIRPGDEIPTKGPDMPAHEHDEPQGQQPGHPKGYL